MKRLPLHFIPALLLLLSSCVDLPGKVDWSAQPDDPTMTENPASTADSGSEAPKPGCDDNTDCTPIGACGTATCSEGVCEYSVRAEGTACGESGQCTADGVCSVCETDNDCLSELDASTDSCSQVTCQAGECVTKPAPDDAACRMSTQCNDPDGCTACDTRSDCPAPESACAEAQCVDGLCQVEQLTRGTACGESGLCNPAGDCVECLANADCAAGANDCQNATCNDGTCHLTDKAAGETCGDGQMCDGAGECVECLKAEHCETEACQDAECSEGRCVFTQSPAETACGQDDRLSCDADGNCAGCSSDDECGEADECSSFRCDDGICERQLEEEGTLVESVGCMMRQCDEDGNVQVVLDNERCSDGDFCNGAETCTGSGKCEAGEPPCEGHNTGPSCTDSCNEDDELCNAFDSSGTACGSDGEFFCDGEGSCGECLEDEDCSAAGPCSTAECSSGSCLQVPVNQGTLVTASSTSDCRSQQCDGTGDVEWVPDPAQCDDGVFCNGPEVCSITGRCEAGVPPCAGHNLGPVCNDSCDEDNNNCKAPDAKGSDCGSDGTYLCDDSGDCGECVTHDDCEDESSPFCDDGACVTCVSNSDCTAAGECFSAICAAGTCTQEPIANGTVLSEPSGDDCRRKQCDGSGGAVFLPIHSQCSDGFCNGAGACKECLDHEDCDDELFCTGVETCGADGTCRTAANPCPGADGDSDCSESCDEASDSCTAPDEARTPCGTALLCDGAGSCKECLSHADCDNGAYCDGAETCGTDGTCADAPDPCPGPDGDSNCSESCNETNDSCTAHDTSGTCGTNRVCNGAGACQCQSGFKLCGSACIPNSQCCSDGDCNDGKFCNGTETCSAGTCQPGSNPCPGPDGDADCSESCDEENNNCKAHDTSGTCGTDRECNGAGVCQCKSGFRLCGSTCIPSSQCCTNADCDNGAYCDGTETCSAGTCQPGSNPCPGADGDADCSESCNETSDNCTGNDPTGTSCGTGLACNSSGNCTCAPGTKICGSTCIPDSQCCTNSDCPGDQHCDGGSCTCGSVSPPQLLTDSTAVCQSGQFKLVSGHPCSANGATGTGIDYKRCDISTCNWSQVQERCCRAGGQSTCPFEF